MAPLESNKDTTSALLLARWGKEQVRFACIAFVLAVLIMLAFMLVMMVDLVVIVFMFVFVFVFVCFVVVVVVVARARDRVCPPRPLRRCCAPTPPRPRVKSGGISPFSLSCAQNCRAVAAGTIVCGARPRARFGTRVTGRCAGGR